MTSKIRKDSEPRFRVIESGSIKQIKESGIYYLKNAVTDKPVSTGGMLVIAFTDSGGSGLYMANLASGNSNYRVRVVITSNTWDYYAL